MKILFADKIKERVAKRKWKIQCTELKKIMRQIDAASKRGKGYTTINDVIQEENVDVLRELGFKVIRVARKKYGIYW